MTYLIEYAIEETITHEDGEQVVTCDRGETSADRDAVFYEAVRRQTRFNEYAAKQNSRTLMKCNLVQIQMGYATNSLHSDAHPFEIVRVVSDKTIEVRAMDAERSPDWKPEFVSGGFAGHCTNNDDQRNAWVMKSNADNPVVRIRKRKNGSWYSPSHGRFYLSEAPFKKHDFNF